MATDLDLPTREQARALTDRIKVAVEGTWQLIREAYTSRTWAVLGYDTWDAYVSSEFGSARLALPREERAETVASLREAGMSIPAIASATRLGVGTVHRSLSSTFPDGKVDQPDLITGVNGKSYAAVRSTEPRQNIWSEASTGEVIDAELVDEPAPAEPPKVKRRPLPEAFTDAGRDLTRAAERLSRLAEDDRFNKNRTHTHQQVPELLGALEHTVRLVQAMNLPTATASEEARRWWATSLHKISDALTGIANSIEQEK
ncbi:hypothetical protein [Streptomyces sp. NEAU-174]|uniref:hypothetical protein n=1 Tax=Streptomyces sp. NEAU-174 TaxID=3458254 RepID=UPI0040443586